jgi:hypothetical protein
MPEVISKHPEVTIQVLQGAGAACGEGAPQRILTKCPPERFCATSTGEICVYGLNEIPQMTQIESRDLMQAFAAPPTQEQEPTVKPSPVFGAGFYILIFLALAVGVVLGVALSRRLSKRVLK